MLGSFDHVVSMDVLIHYNAEDVVGVIESLAARTSESILFTFAPSTKMLLAMLAVGRFFPKRDSSPALAPVKESELRSRLSIVPNFTVGRNQRVSAGFYKSHALEMVRT